jgi:CDGSH-type Zn-finger protein
VAYEDGPYLVRGSFVVRDQDGREVVSTRRTIALCRCGKSRMRPLCDGTHRTIGFRAPSHPEHWPPAGGDGSAP